MRDIIESIKAIEIARTSVYRLLSDEEYYAGEVPLGTRLPTCKVEHVQIVDFEAIKLEYEGALPLYDSDKEYEIMIRDYYIQATVQALKKEGVQKRFNKAIMVINHLFANEWVIRDHDNRNRKHLIDAIRYAGLIENDSWKKLSILEEGRGCNDGNDRVLVYVFERLHLNYFLQDFMSK